LGDLYRVAPIAADLRDDAAGVGGDPLDHQGFFRRQAVAELRQWVEGEDGQCHHRQQQQRNAEC
jgi:hypothetical protein